MKLLTLLFCALFALQPTGHSVQWSVSSETSVATNNPATTAAIMNLTISADIPDGVVIHPYGNVAGATSVTLEGPFEICGAPTEKYDDTIYKGESAVSGKYTLTLVVKKADSGHPESTGDVATGRESGLLKGCVRWMECSGDACSMPQEWEFSVPVPGGPDAAATSKRNEDTGTLVPASSTGMATESIWSLILEAILWGLAMILTPCVFPMVPMTVSFFLKNPSGARAGRVRATFYGIFIILLYTVPICLVTGATLLFGGQGVTADIFNWLSTHWLPNILFFIVFMVFAASLLGAFEITLPSEWVNGADKKSDAKGLGGAFFLALTLVLVSFSCTGPIVGTVLIKSTRGEFWAPMVTMLAFSTAFALPFTLLAWFPSTLKKLPKSGGWLNSVKVVLGFIEIALGLKFLSVADQTYHWHLLDREVYLAIWIVDFTLLGFYLLGKLRFAGDSPVEKINVKRLALAIATFSFVVYMIPGMWGAPLKALSGYLPPVETQDFIMETAPAVQQNPSWAGTDTGRGEVLDMPYGLRAYDNIEAGLAAAAVSGKKVFVDVTGYGCVNCREMESRVWSDPEVLRMLRDDYVMVALYNDDKTPLPEDKWIRTAEGKVLKDVGRVNSHIARTRFNVNSQPAYALLSPDGRLLAPVRGYSLNVEEFREFLQN